MRRSGTAALLMFALGACTSPSGADAPPRWAAPRPALSATTASGSVGVVVERGLIDCFEAGLLAPPKGDKPGSLVHCEASAAVFDGHRIIIASDKPIPQHSPVFSLASSGSDLAHAPREFLMDEAFLEARKLEDMTLTPDGALAFAITGFDRVQRDSSDDDSYNTLLAWRVSPQVLDVRRVHGEQHGNVRSSVGLRRRFAAALVCAQHPGGPAYFKIEALAAIPGSRLLFGVREVGRTHKDFAFAVKILAAPYQVSASGEVTLGELRLVYDADTTLPVLGRSLAVSSLEYDRFGDRLLLLTSFEMAESDEGIGAFLWTLTLKDFEAGRSPKPVVNEAGEPLLLAHKGEAVTVLSKGRVLIVADDDRVTGRPATQVTDPARHFFRLPHQASFTIVELR